MKAEYRELVREAQEEAAAETREDEEHEAKQDESIRSADEK